MLVDVGCFFGCPILIQNFLYLFIIHKKSKEWVRERDAFKFLNEDKDGKYSQNHSYIHLTIVDINNYQMKQRTNDNGTLGAWIKGKKILWILIHVP